MTDVNPYRPTAAMLAEAPPPEPAGGYWRDGKLLVTFSENPLPNRCVKCNAPTEPPRRPRKVYWHAAWWYLLILVNIVIYIIVALVVRKSAKVPMTMCRRHLMRRRLFIAFGWVGFIACLFGGAVLLRGMAAGVAVGFLGGLLCAVIGVIGARVLWPVKIDSPFVYLKGCGEAYLAELPEFADRRYAKMREWSVG